jgi:hypothetical protein
MSYHCNAAVEKSLDHKMCPRYLGPYIIISHNTGYILAKLDNTIPKNTISAFCVIPYHSHKSIPLPNIFNIIDISSSELQRHKQLNEQDDKFIAEDFYNAIK